MANAINAGKPPELIMHTGDLAMDGADHRKDLELAMQWNNHLPADVHAIPGNHDIGDLPDLRASQPLNDKRLARWDDVVGADRWLIKRGGWRLIGLNAMLLGTGHPRETEQFNWLSKIAQSADTCPVAIFTHKPLCIDALDEGPRDYWTVAPGPRQHLCRILDRLPVKMIASGHLHIARQKTIAGISHVWCPAASFVVGAMQEDLGGERRIGYVEHSFNKDTVVSRIVFPDGVQDLELDPYAGEICPT